MAEIGYIKRREEATVAEVARLERAFKRISEIGQTRRNAEVAMLEAMEELDRIQIAQRSLSPLWRGRFPRCTVCGNPFNDEGSFLAHWGYQWGRLRCTRDVAMLRVAGFVADTYATSGPERVFYVLRHPDRQAL